MKKDDVTSVCEGCGASVYKQHIDSGIARYEDGKLLCSHCVVEAEKAHERGEQEEAFEPIEFDDDERTVEKEPESAKTRIHSATKATLGMAAAWDDSRFKRGLSPAMNGATRCRIFHCKLSEGAVDFMVHQINEWLDQSEDIVIKFSNSTIGNFEGKHTEPNLIVTLYY